MLIAGNIFYKQGDHKTATVKYKKCCKYITCLRDTVGSTEDEEEKSEESLVEKRERIGKLLRATSLQPPEGSGKALHNYREIIRASRNSMPEGPAAAMH